MNAVPPLPDLLQEANRCVACGLCLPHCPTYRKTESEADSPRGRIALMRGELEQRIPLNARYVQHLEQCLTCRACERVCPSGVRYGKLVDGARAMIAQRQGAGRGGLQNFLLDQLVPHSGALRASAKFFRVAQKTGLVGVVSKVLPLNEFLRQLPKLPAQVSWREVYPAASENRGGVALFLGCASQVTDPETLSATIFVLNRLGYTVHVPKRQTCCGAMHQHGGAPAKAAALAQRNAQAFAERAEKPIISTASGCGAMLAEYDQVLGEAGRAFASRVADVSGFLDRAAGWDAAAIEPLTARIAVHDSCSLRNVLRAEDAPYRLLRRIPQADIVPLAGNDQCCGSAGLYALDQPDMAGRLMSDKIAAIRDSGARFVATSNIGCALGLMKALRAADMRVEVLHPVTLLARQMGFKNDV